MEIVFREDSPSQDPASSALLIAGRAANLKRLSFLQLSHKLQPRVNNEIWEAALESLGPCQKNSAETVPLYLKQVTLAGLPLVGSRHNSPARPHTLATLLKSGSYTSVLVVCEYSEVYAYAGAIARSYPQCSYKTAQGNARSQDTKIKVSVEFFIADSDNAVHQLTDPEDLNVLNSLAKGVRLAADIVDRPTNFMHISHFLGEIKGIAEEYGLDYKVIRGEELAKAGLGGIYGVGKASLEEPALAVLTYSPPSGQAPSATVAWVGKGIVYDTGGLSIKGKTNMPGMKRDCGGAAAVLGALLVVARSGSSARVHGVFCLAENSVGPRATRPDDVHTLLSGRTVEVNNTDAEGRLVLADGCVYAQRYLSPDVIVDVATLTGAQGMTTGKYHGAILTNSEQWEAEAVRLSKISGDLLFPLVFCPELHFSEFNSAIADMKNSVNDRWNAQSSCAGLFILSHIGFDTELPWLHIDMASPVHCGERATGYGVALLPLLFGRHSQSKLLNKLSL